MTRRLIASCLGLVAVLVVGLSYLLVVVIGKNPMDTPTHVVVELPISGGLLERSNVSLRGTVVGRVQRIRLTDDGVSATVTLDEGVRVPKDTDVVVGSLSLAGEQFIDFRPRSASGPFLEDGAVVSRERVTVPVAFAKLLTDVVALADEIDPADLRTISRELAVGLGDGERDLRTLFGNSSVLMNALEDSLPDTRALLDNGNTLLDTAVDLRGDLDTIATSSRKLARDLRKANPSFNVLLDEGPAAADLALRLGSDLRQPMVEVLDTLGRLDSILGPRVPAVGALLPALERAAFDASLIFHNGTLHVLGDLGFQRSCRYGTPKKPPTVGGMPSPLLYGYCTTYSPDMQQRGPYYAPMPAGDDTYFAPPGVTGNERAGPRP
jgi:virulence factor Mce-like protein